MKNRISQKLFQILISMFSLAILPIAYSQTYTVGSMVEDYNFTDYNTGETTSLYELGSDGGVLVLEWFAYWCPFCANAANNTQAGISEYYKETNGNPHGVEVKHISLNVQGDARSNSDVFINKYGLETVLEDYNRDFFSLFSPGGGQPLFAIINAEAGSHNTERWKVLFVQLTYGSFPDISALMRPYIDAVEAGVVEMYDPFLVNFPDLIGTTGGPYESEWFGGFSGVEYPLIEHEEHGRIAIYPTPEELFLFDSDLGWLATFATLYPYFYSYPTGNWLFYAEGSAGRWYYDYAIANWREK